MTHEDMDRPNSVNHGVPREPFNLPKGRPITIKDVPMHGSPSETELDEFFQRALDQAAARRKLRNAFEMPNNSVV